MIEFQTPPFPLIWGATQGTVGQSTEAGSDPCSGFANANVTASHFDIEQAWFWAPEWLSGEEEATADIQAGRFDRSLSDEDFLQSLED